MQGRHGERERERERERGRDLRLRQHMLSTQKTYTMPLVNKVVGMPLGANLDCDLRRCCGFVSERAVVCSLHVSVSFTLNAPLK